MAGNLNRSSFRNDSGYQFVDTHIHGGNINIGGKLPFSKSPYALG
jgi:hypothetical protein